MRNSVHISNDPCIMTGGQIPGTEPARHLHESTEFYQLIATGTGVWRPSRLVFSGEIPHYPFLEAALERSDVVWYPQMTGNPHSIAHSGRRAIPQAHRYSDNFMPLGFEERCSD